jgi:2-haloacid dehalogenase
MVSVGSRPVLVFDVNETLLDIDALEPVFEEIFGEPGRMREWFAQFVLYSQSLSLSEIYVPFEELGGGVLQMVGAIHGTAVTDDDIGKLSEAIATLPVHRDVASALEQLAEAGFRMVTLTNSSGDSMHDPLTDAGVAQFFEQRFTVKPVERFKPSPSTYKHVTNALKIAPDRCLLVAAHVWDTIGAQAVGWKSALITRGVNAAIPTNGVPQPDFIERDMLGLAQTVIASFEEN